MIKFEKVSKEEFFKSVVEDDRAYDNLSIPRRNSSGSVGYDFFSPVSLIINPGEKVLIPTGIKVKYPKDVAFLIVIRSSMALNHGILLTNQVAVIDSDYYGDKINEGHVYVGLLNTGNVSYTIHEGDKIAQGLFVPCLFATNEEELGKRDGWSYMKEKRE